MANQPPRRKRPSPRRVALVRLDRIGDFLLWLGTAPFYRQYFENCEITFFGNEALLDIAPALPYWDRFVPVKVSDITADIADLSFFEDQFDIVYNLHYSRVASLEEFVARLRAPTKIAIRAQGPNITNQQYATYNAIYSSLLELDPAPVHELVRNFEILDKITGSIHTPVVGALTDVIEAPLSTLPKRYAAIFPGGSWKKKNFPWPRLVKACQLLAAYGVSSILCGSVEDVPLSANIYNNIDKDVDVIDLTGRLSLRQSFGLIAGSALTIANDSMAAHAANCLDVPSICFLGGGYNIGDQSVGRPPPGRFFPYPEGTLRPALQRVLWHPMSCTGCSYLCKYDDDVRDTIPCIEYIPLNDLLNEIRAILSPPVTATAPSIPPCDAVPYLNGLEIEFAEGAARPFLARGWSHDEADHVWIEGTTATLLFRLEAPRSKPTLMSISSHSYENGGVPNQCVVVLNGTFIGVLEGTGAWEEHALPISNIELQEVNVLALFASKADKPPADSRHLSFAIRSIRFVQE